MAKENRLDYIFRQLGQGVSSAELNKQLDQRRFEGEEARRKAREAETKIAGILAGLKIVDQIIQAQPNDKMDKQGIDVKVITRIPEIRTVHVQVKATESTAMLAKKKNPNRKSKEPIYTFIGTWEEPDVVVKFYDAVQELYTARMHGQPSQKILDKIAKAKAEDLVKVGKVV